MTERDGGRRSGNYPAPAHSFALRLGDELALRLTERHHAAGLFELVDRDRDHLKRFIPWTATATRESVRLLVSDELRRFGRGEGWRAELCWRGEPVGLMWLHEWGGPGGSTEVGYLVASVYEGKGLVTRSLRALFDHFFEERGLGRVAIGLDARNERSLAVVRRLGLKPEVVLRRLITVDGAPADLSVFGVLREEREPFGDVSLSTRPPRFALRADPHDDVYVAVPEREDVDELHALVEANRERLATWLPWARTPGREVQERFVSEVALPALARGDGSFEGTIWYRGRIVGAVGVHGVDEHGRFGSIGYWLDAAHEGKGIATRAVAALVDRCFSEPLLNGRPFERLSVLARVDNVRSRAVPERLGFVLEGVMRRQNLGPEKPDMAVYSLLRHEWESRRGGGAG